MLKWESFNIINIDKIQTSYFHTCKYLSCIKQEKNIVKLMYGLILGRIFCGHNNLNISFLSLSLPKNLAFMKEGWGETFLALFSCCYTSFSFLSLHFLFDISVDILIQFLEFYVPCISVKAVRGRSKFRTLHILVNSVFLYKLQSWAEIFVFNIKLSLPLKSDIFNFQH